MDRLYDSWTDFRTDGQTGGQMDRLVSQKVIEGQWTERQTSLMKKIAEAW